MALQKTEEGKVGGVFMQRNSGFIKTKIFE